MDLFGHEDPEDRLARERQMSYASHEEIKRVIEACHRCHLRDEGGLGPVLSTGPADAPLMIVGEGPGRVEDDFCGSIWLAEEIRQVKPKVIIGLGKVALRFFLGRDAGIVRSRGHWIDYHGIPVMPTFHPAYLLRQTGHELVEAKWQVYYDLKAAKERAEEAAPDWVWKSETPPNLLEELTGEREKRHAGGPHF